MMQVYKYCQENGIPLEGHITFAKPQSTGDSLTPWMILHTLGHALFANFQPKEAMIQELLRVVRLYSMERRVEVNASMIMRFFSELFKFKSISNPINKDKATVDTEELVYELVAEYLWHGQIRTNPQAEYYERYRLGDVAKNLEKIIHNQLQASVGKVIVDYFTE